MFLPIHLDHGSSVYPCYIRTAAYTIIIFLVILVTLFISSAFVLVQMFLTVLCIKQSKKMASAQ